MKTRQPIDRSGIGRRDFLKIGAATAASYAVGAPAIAQPRVRSMRFGHMLPPETVYHKAILLFAEEVNKNSGGKMKIDVYPSSQLGSIPEMLSQLKVGSLTMSMAVPAWYSNFMKPIDAFTLPYIVSSTDRLKAALDGNVGKEITKMGQGAGFQVFGYWLIGGRHIVNKVRPSQRARRLPGLQAPRHQQPGLHPGVPRARRQHRGAGSVRALRRHAAGRGRRLRISAARPRSRSSSTKSRSFSRSTSTPRTFSSSRSTRASGTACPRRASHPQPIDEDRDGLAVEGAAGGNRRRRWRSSGRWCRSTTSRLRTKSSSSKRRVRSTSNSKARSGRTSWRW